MTLLSCLYKSVLCDHSFKMHKPNMVVVHHDPSIVYFIYGGNTIIDGPLDWIKCALPL